jgi:hypothetical protein
MRNIALYSVLAAASLLMIFSGCQTPHVEVAESTIMQQYLPYIQDGSTTREDVLLKLGVPSAQYEEERILTYVLRLSENDHLYVVTHKVPSWCPGVYSLVLVFGPDNVLKKHSLVVGR